MTPRLGGLGLKMATWSDSNLGALQQPITFEEPELKDVILLDRLLASVRPLRAVASEPHAWPHQGLAGWQGSYTAAAVMFKPYFGRGQPC